jgi:hypothetical protein
LPRLGSMGRSTLRLEKSSPGGITFISGIVRPALRLALSTRSKSVSYLPREQASDCPCSEPDSLRGL